jgi:hypothetical protein
MFEQAFYKKEENIQIVNVHMKTDSAQLVIIVCKYIIKTIINKTTC